MPVEFDITPFVNKDDNNTLSVQIYKWSDGSYFEDQDFWRLSGFERDVKLIARPQISIADFSVIASLDKKYTDGDFSVAVTVDNSTLRSISGYKIRLSLLDENNKSIWQNAANRTNMR